MPPNISTSFMLGFMSQLFLHGWLGQAQVFSARHDSNLLNEYKVQLLNWQLPRYVSHY